MSEQTLKFRSCRVTFYDVRQSQGWQRNIIMDGRPHLPANIRQ